MNINSSYRKVWFARLISILGTGLTSFGVSVWVYTVTGKATPMVLILLFSILPAIFLAPFSGYLCDKYNRKAIIICADSIAALISVFIYICVSYYEFNYFVTPILNTVAGTLWMQETPRILQGRVFASRSMIARCFVPLSYVVVGPLVDIVLPKLLQSNLGLIINVVGTQALEYRLVFCGAGVLCVLITCCVAANTNFRKL